MFHPKVSRRAMIVSRSADDFSQLNQIGDSGSKEESAKRLPLQEINSLQNKKKEKVHSESQKYTKPPINRKSGEIIQSKERAVIDNLFNMMDTDGDGLISPERICIDSICTDQLRVISPLLFELEDLNQTLNRVEFNEAVNILLKRLTPQEKHLFSFGRKSSANDPNLTFKVFTSLSSARNKQELASPVGKHPPIRPPLPVRLLHQREAGRLVLTVGLQRGHAQAAP
jgi:hypothetical protein